MSYSKTVDSIINRLGADGVLDTPEQATLLILAICDQIDADVDAVAKALNVDTLTVVSISYPGVSK